MHTKRQEIIVYTIGGIGFLAILVLNLKSGFSTDSLLAILKDLSPLMISVMLFYMLNGLLGMSDFKKSANRAIEKIQQYYMEKGIFYKNTVLDIDNENAKECLYFENKGKGKREDEEEGQKTQFISLQDLRKGILEIRISYGTLAKFEIISPKDTDKEDRIAKKKQEVKEKTIKILQTQGTKFEVLHDNKDSAVKIQFLPNQHISYEKILEEVIVGVIKLLEGKTETANN